MNDSKTKKDAAGFGQRMKLRRLAKGWSLDDLASEMGGLVTKQALSKYEKEQTRPTPRVLQKLAQALTVSAAHLTQPAQETVNFVAYRKTSGLGLREREQMEARVEVEMLERVRLQKLIGQELDLPTFSTVETLEDAERAAEELRVQWNLGVDAICSLSTVLEDHGIHIIETDAPEKFDGLSSLVRDGEGHCIAAAVIAKRDLPGDRWRLTIAHELGHLVLKFAPGAEEKWIEKAAFRFGSALLAPRQLVEREVGLKRHRMSPQELFLFKPRFGMSAQAITYRLKDLGILPEEQSGAIFQQFQLNGWKKNEPFPLELEHPTWLKRSVYHALSEGLISTRDARRFLGNEFEEEAAPPEPESLRQKRAFLRLPMDERRRILKEQSEAAGDMFFDDPEWEAWEAFSDPIEWADDLDVAAPGRSG